jgi:hypothetical protein
MFSHAGHWRSRRRLEETAEADALALVDNDGLKDQSLGGGEYVGRQCASPLPRKVKRNDRAGMIGVAMPASGHLGPATLPTS